jgi:hypothetical protein
MVIFIVAWFAGMGAFAYLTLWYVWSHRNDWQGYG